MSNVGTFSFTTPAPAIVVNSTIETRSTPITNGQSIEFFVDVIGGGVSQVSTLTITAGSTGNTYAASLSTGLSTDPDVYSYNQEAGDTGITIAARLAKEINLDSRIQAKSTGNVITMTGVLPGQAITLDVSLSTTPGNIILATTTPASGTALVRKLIKLDASVSVNSANQLELTMTPTMFSGDSAATPLGGSIPIVRAHTKTMATIKTENS